MGAVPPPGCRAGVSLRCVRWPWSDLTRVERVLALLAAVLLVAGGYMLISAGTDGYGISLVAASSGISAVVSLRRLQRVRR